MNNIEYKELKWPSQNLNDRYSTTLTIRNIIDHANQSNRDVSSALNELIDESNSRFGNNVFFVKAKGTAKENYDEFVSVYNEFSRNKGNWSLWSSYNENDIAYYLGIPYVINSNISGSVFTFPEVDMTDNSKWRYIDSSETEYDGLYDIGSNGPAEFSVGEFAQMFIETSTFDEDLQKYVYEYRYDKFECISPITFNKNPLIDKSRWSVYTGQIIATPSSTNRYTIILNSGYYDGIFNLNRQYVDVIGLAERSATVNGIKITANNIYVSGLTVRCPRRLSTKASSENITVPLHGLSVGDGLATETLISVKEFHPAGVYEFSVRSIIDENTITLTTVASGNLAIPKYSSTNIPYSTGIIVGNNLSGVKIENVDVYGSYGIITSPSSVVSSPRYISGIYNNINLYKISINQSKSLGVGEVLSGTFTNIYSTQRINANGATSGYFNNIRCMAAFCNQNSTSVVTSYHTGDYNNIYSEEPLFLGRCDGVFRNVHGKTYSFGSFTGANASLVISKGTFYGCTGGPFSFSGTYGSDPHATLGKTRFSGKAYNCVMGWGSGGGLTDDAGMDGVMVNCAITNGTTLASFPTTLPYFKSIKPRICSISVGNPAVITYNDHGKIKGDAVKFSSTISLPSGILPDTDYYVLESGLTNNSFTMSLTPNGTPVETTDAGDGVHSIILGRYINCIDGTGALIDTVN